MSIIETAALARQVSTRLAAAKTEQKNKALQAISDALQANAGAIIEANQQDLAQAEKDNLAAPLLKRLKFDEGKIDGVCAGIDSLIGIDDPVGATLNTTELDSGLELYKVTCPIGVIGVIFESRPDALVQISTLCLKSGNAVLLKGGSEAMQTNRILADTITAATTQAGIDAGWLGLMETRGDVAEMLKLDAYIDLIIPRGSNEFVQHIMNNSNIPVLGHADGICHVYLDSEADIDMAVNIA
ncbi:MAG: aldehyde dehydrogenase family protein, partial [Planctomycetota bacterium]